MYISLACSYNGMYHGDMEFNNLASAAFEDEPIINTREMTECGVWGMEYGTYSQLLHTEYVCPAENYGSISGDPMEYSARLVLSSAWLICRIGPFLVWFICNPVEWPNSAGVYSGQLANHGKMQDPWSCFSRGFVNRIGIG